MSIVPDEKRLKALDKYAMVAMLAVSLTFNYIQYDDCKECEATLYKDKKLEAEAYKDGFNRSTDILKMMFNYERPKVTDSVFSPALMQR